MTFKKAERTQAKLKLGLSGPSGSGKTMSALRMATAIGKKIAVIDTENGSASLYADKFDFDTLSLEPPFTADKYVAAIEAAERAGYEVIIVDSFSHAWAGEGGTLDKKADLDARGGNGFGNWRGPKSDYARIKNALLHSSAHVIATIRSKQAYAITNENGSNKVQRLGLDPIAEPGLEYEFSVLFEIAINHKAQATKDRTSLFGENVFLITEETGQKLMKWLAEAKAPEPPKATETESTAPKTEPEKKSGSGVPCDLCKTELVLHSSGAGYICPKAKAKKDGHTRFSNDKLTEYQARAKTLGLGNHSQPDVNL